MKKIAALFCLAFALLVCAIPRVHADDPDAVPVPPAAPPTLAIWYYNNNLNNPLYTLQYEVTEIDYTDGTVDLLDTSDGSTFTLNFSTDGTYSFVTQYDSNGNPVAQWVYVDQ